jgi:hypothetical protein
MSDNPKAAPKEIAVKATKTMNVQIPIKGGGYVSMRIQEGQTYSFLEKDAERILKQMGNEKPDAKWKDNK